MLTEIERAITSAVDRLGPSVAGVESLRRVRHRVHGAVVVPAHATAIVLDPTGYLVTNHHVIEGTVGVTVRLADGRDLPARVVGGDEGTDLAVVKADTIDVPAAPLGDSGSLRVGQIVLAIGHALGLPGGPTVSTGVVSALGRPLPGSDLVFEGLIQTDAAINPGNSGGPLADLSGAVVGLNTAMVPFAQGVGFALPVHAVRRIADELRREGRVVRPWVGVEVSELRPDVAGPRGLPPGSGLLVARVVPRSPAHRAGLRPGDVVRRVGPFEVRSVRSLLEGLSRFPVGADIEVQIERRGSTIRVSVPLEESPPPARAE